MNPQIWWFLARASGIVAWLMMTGSMACGIVLAAKAVSGRGRPAWVLAMHRWFGALTLAFLAVHIAALVADSYVTFGLADITVPFASDWRPNAVALGVISMWLLVVVEISSLAMRRLPRKLWRGVHLSSYAAFWATSMHGAFAGTDTTSWWYRITGAVAVVAVTAVLMYRIANRRAERRLERDDAAVPRPVRRAAAP